MAAMSVVLGSRTWCAPYAAAITVLGSSPRWAQGLDRVLAPHGDASAAGSLRIRVLFIVEGALHAKAWDGGAWQWESPVMPPDGGEVVTAAPYVVDRADYDRVGALVKSSGGHLYDHAAANATSPRTWSDLTLSEGVSLKAAKGDSKPW